MSDLYGLDRAVDLVRDFAERPKEREARRARPVLVFVGPRGSGKTTLLDELAAELEEQVPYARLDLARVDGMPLHEMLAALAFELNRKCGRYGRIGFHRFVVGRLVMALTDLPEAPEAKRRAVKMALEGYGNAPMLRTFLAGIAPMVPGALGLPAIPGVDAVTEQYLPDLLLDGLVSWRHSRKVVLGKGQDWYGRDSLHALVQLNRRFQHYDNEVDRREVDEILLGAFLADLVHSFDGARRTNRCGYNCVLLLDNADHSDGLDLLTAFADARQDADDKPDPLTVVATSRGYLPARTVPAWSPLPAIASAGLREWDRLRKNVPQAKVWYPVLLDDLTIKNVVAMAKSLRLQVSSERRTAELVHGFTHGHPASTRLLLTAIAERPGNAGNLRSVFGQTEPGKGSGTTVSGRLLDDFVRGRIAEVIEELTTVSAARDADEAETLIGPGDLLSGRIDEETLFAPELWMPGTGSDRIVLHPVPRRLLLDRLAERPPDDPMSWDAVHESLRANAAAAKDEAGELYHALALDQVDVVTRRLLARLVDLPADEWLQLLLAIVAAPNGGDDAETPTTRVEALIGSADPEDQQAMEVAELVSALWILADPLTDVQRRGPHLMAAGAYEAIARSAYRKGRAVLQTRAQDHRDLSKQWEDDERA